MTIVDDYSLEKMVKPNVLQKIIRLQEIIYSYGMILLSTTDNVMQQHQVIPGCPDRMLPV